MNIVHFNNKIISGVLSQSSEEFDSSEDIYEAIGEILHEVSSNKTEDEIRNLCDKFHAILKPENDRINQKNQRTLDSPMQRKLSISSLQYVLILDIL